MDNSLKEGVNVARQNGISIEDMLKLDVMKSCKLIAGFRVLEYNIKSEYYGGSRYSGDGQERESFY